MELAETTQNLSASVVEEGSPVFGAEMIQLFWEVLLELRDLIVDGLIYCFCGLILEVDCGVSWLCCTHVYIFLLQISDSHPH